MNAQYTPPQKSTFRWFQALLLLSLCLLIYADHKGVLAPLQQLLDEPSFTYSFGKYQVSLYTILKSVLLVGVIIWLATWIAQFAEQRIGRMTYIHPSSRALIQKLSSFLLYVIAALTAMSALGIDLRTLTVFGGAVGIGLGFGLQKVASNFISGLILLMERSMKLGDMVEMEDGTLGTVRRTGARSTLIETFDGRTIMIPNENFITGKVINWTFSDAKSRMTINVGVAYGCDLRLAQKLIIDAAKENPNCLIDPAPRCFLKEFGESAANFILLFWVGDVTKEFFSTRSDVMFAIWQKFKENGIEIPYPQREIRIKKDE